MDIKPTQRHSGMLRINMQFFGDGSTSSAEGATGAQTNQTDSNTQNNQNASEGQRNDSQSNAADSATLEKLIQSAVDRATNKLGNENKSLKKQLDDLMKQKLTDDERVELERKQEREQFEQEKAQFIADKNRLHAVTALAKADISIAADKLDSLVGLVMGKDESEIDANVKNLTDIVKIIVAAKVEQTFRDSGRNPAGSGNPTKPDSDKDSIGTTLGKSTAAANAKANEVLKHYLGG